MANINAMKILGSLLNSGAVSKGSGSNILGSVLGALSGSGGQSSQGGGLGDLLGSVLGGGGGNRAQTRGAGGMDDLLGQLGGSGQAGGLGALIGMAMQSLGQASSDSGAQPARFDLPGNPPQGMNREQAEHEATLLIQAMINAAKADGHVDKAEQEKILGRLGDITQDEIDFVRRELASPLDAAAFARSIPRGMEQQIYAVSLMAIDLDSNPEAQYLHQLAQGCGLSSEVCNQIHEQLGAPALYR